MDIEALISLALYFVLMMAIGLYAYRKSTDDVSGYMLGGRQLNPAVASLSAGASDMSGWMLMGLPGAIFATGMSEAWIAIGLMIGAYFNYRLVAPRLRVYTEIADDAITIPDFFEKRFADHSRMLRVISAVVIIIFFTLYTSAGVVSGGKLFEASFGLDYRLGLFLTAGVVVAYTLFGGFLAVSLTDFVQGCIMFVALVLVPVVTIMQLGGFGPTVDALSTLSVDVGGWEKSYLSMIPQESLGLAAIGIISTMSWGLGYFGQPHIIVRFMAVRSLKDVAVMRRIGMSWMLITVLGAVLTGAAGLAYVKSQNIDVADGVPIARVIEAPTDATTFSELDNIDTTGAFSDGDVVLGDQETIFILLSQVIFHPYIAGFLLAAILAAIMSTISSQLLVSSSSLTEDFYKIFLRRGASQKELVLVGRLSVLAVSLVAIALAFDPDSNILNLVSNAWAGFGAAFGPVVLISLFWRGMTRLGAIAGMVTGAVTVLAWIYVFNLSGVMYEIVPGFIAATIAIIVVSMVSKDPESQVTDYFDEMTGILKKGELPGKE
ncbi:MAG: sodium:proline symporter [Oceanicaulis sp.]|uniref:Sodium/proline symporter n=1 Tax=Maricaulis virginensis TaxID=144022 RepID=A0A9W6MNW7_9PROT|nr:sodium/solute symporter [Maricaulis virginensis]MBI74531.1 sodium:proline symporter [Oceanicaulis sp.]GLK52543.1 sodium:proline symporter [Maricaulis virginensis]